MIQPETASRDGGGSCTRGRDEKDDEKDRLPIQSRYTERFEREQDKRRQEQDKQSDEPLVEIEKERGPVNRQRCAEDDFRQWIRSSNGSHNRGDDKHEDRTLRPVQREHGAGPIGVAIDT